MKAWLSEPENFAPGVPAYFEKRPDRKYQGHTLLAHISLKRNVLPG